MHPVTVGALSRDKSAAPLPGIAGTLANTRLFALCSSRELRKVAKLAKIRRIPKGTRLMTEGDDGDSMYVILSGMARVSRNGRRVALIGAGDAVGELALLARRSATRRSTPTATSRSPRSAAVRSAASSTTSRRSR